MKSVLVLAVLAAGCAAAASPTRPFKGTPHAIPGLIEVEDFDEGPEGVAYHDLEPKNQGAPYRDTGVDIEPRADASNRFNLGWTRPGEWLVYTVDVREAGTYTIEMRVACKGQGGVFHLEFDGVDRSGAVTVPDTGGWEHMKPLVHRGVKLAAGRQTMKLVMGAPGVSKSIGDIDFFKFVREGP
jgi:hypothetical protein